jgi:hypothetical protein
MNLYDFLKSQDGSILFWYGVFIIAALSIIVSGIQSIFKSYFNRNKPPENKGKKSLKDDN